MSDTAKKSIDIYSIGVAAVDEVVSVPTYPRSGEKMAIRSWGRFGGGICLTAMVTAARQGLRCAYDGILGRNDPSEFVREILRREGIGFLEDIPYPHAEPLHSIILVDEATAERTILFYRAPMVEPTSKDIRADRIAASSLLFVDHLGSTGTLEACRIARDARVPIVADLELLDHEAIHEIMALSNHLILSRSMAARVTGLERPEDAAVALAKTKRICTGVTDGARGCWFIEGNEEGNAAVRHQPAFSVQAIDTTGCGDVFHGAYAAALVMGKSVSEAIRWGAATAALKSTRPGGQAGIPDRAAVEAFILSAG